MTTTGTGARFIVGTTVGDASFVCTFVTENGTELLVSRNCATAAEAAAVARLIQLHAGVPDRYERLDEDGGASSFCINNDADLEIARSLHFSTRLARELAIERMMISAPTAPIFGE